MWAKAYPATTHSFYRSPILLLFARRRDSLFAGELFLTTGPHHESLIIFFFCFSVILLDQWLSCQFRIKTKKIIRKKKEKQEINSEIGKNYSLFTTHFHFFFVRQILKLETIKKGGQWVVKSINPARIKKSMARSSFMNVSLHLAHTVSFLLLLSY